ncbi:hypothetical protein HON52_03225 [Candidatus Uhrbacteria bacterium]|jgi:hypothetical protein|nr:hypothetical protein [Candidatus Uhrbacteria bacterium]
MPEVHDNRVKIRKTKPSFTREQRAGFFLVVASGFLAIILGVVYLFDHLSDPFNIQYEGERFVTSDQAREEEIADQRVSDTDGDLLSDYDELYIFGTSMYLADTDGDGDNDFTELQAGTDPTCAAGGRCEDEYSIVGLENEALSAYLDSISTDGQAVEDITDALKDFGPDDIRGLLIEAGATEEQLSEISDEDLQSLYDSVLGDLEESGEIDAIVEETIDIAEAE